MDKAIPIQSESGAHFGFLLFAGNEEDRGECVFMLVPKDSESYEHPDFQFLCRFGAKETGEHKWRKEGDSVSIDLTTGDEATLDLSARTLVFNSNMRFKIV